MLPYSLCNFINESIKNTETFLFTILLKKHQNPQMKQTNKKAPGEMERKSSKKSSVEHVYVCTCTYPRAKSGDRQGGSNWHKKGWGHTQVF